MRKTVRRVLAAVLMLTLLVSGGYIAWKFLDHLKGGEDYAEAAETAGLAELPEEPPPQTPQTSQQIEEESDEPAAEQDTWAAVLAQADLDALRQVNGDVVGWIAIPGTVLSYPLVQTDNNSYYLNRTWKRESSSVGAIFLEHTAAADLSDFHTMIYGHRMRNGTMFGSLRNYNRQDYWREHPSVYVVSGDRVLIYDIFAAYEVGIREIVYRLDVEETGRQEELIQYGLNHSVIDTGVVPTAADRIVTLSTCTGSGHATRWVVQAVLRTDTE